MSLSRRRFVQTLGVGAAGAMTSAFVGARGREALAGLWARGVETPLYAAEAGKIIISSNENPMGPGKAVLDAVRAALGAHGAKPGRYPFTAEYDLTSAVAQKFGVKPENVLIGCGSTQILRTCTQVFTSKTRALVGSAPTYEECAGYAKDITGAEVRAIPLDSQLRMDLDATLAASKGAGLIFFCNPNNPTATLHSANASQDFITKVLKSSPDTSILVDEAYFDYATDPSYKTMIPLALNEPRVVVARTFSKAYGMAGLRIGYAIAHADTIKKLAGWESGGSINTLALAGGLAAIQQDSTFIERERARNKEARDFTRAFFHKNGYKDSESHTNFLFVDVKMPIQKFQAACREQNVLVGRPFPPLLTYARISLGTMEEMKRATAVFASVLGVSAKAAA